MKKPPVEYEQQLVWMEWEKRTDMPSGGRFKRIHHDREPDRVWTLWMETEQDKKPTLPIVPVHRHNAFFEDSVHDWNWMRGQFSYYTRVMGQSCWVLLEYKKK